MVYRAPRPDRRWPKYAIGAGIVVVLLGFGFMLATHGFDLGKVQEPSGDPDAYVDDATGFEIILPDTWTSASLVANDQVGADMFPDDPGKAAAAQDAFVPSGAGDVFAAVVTDRFGGLSGTIALVVHVAAAPGGKAAYDTVVADTEAGLADFGAMQMHDDTVRFLDGDGVRIEFTLQEPQRMAGLAYGGVVEDRAWGLFLVGPKRDLEDRAEEIDAIAASFRVTK